MPRLPLDFRIARTVDQRLRDKSCSERMPGEICLKTCFRNIPFDQEIDRLRCESFIHKVISFADPSKEHSVIDPSSVDPLLQKKHRAARLHLSVRDGLLGSFPCRIRQ